MCNVCCASDAIEQTRHGRAARFAWPQEEPGKRYTLEAWRALPLAAVIFVEAECDTPEFTPGRLRVRRDGEERWTDWVDTGDLASSMAALGTDVRWAHVPAVAKAWIEGGEDAPLLDTLKREDVIDPTSRLVASAKRARLAARRLTWQRSQRRVAGVLARLGDGWRPPSSTRSSRYSTGGRFTHTSGARLTIYALGGVHFAWAKARGHLQVDKRQFAGTLPDLLFLFTRVQ